MHNRAPVHWIDNDSEFDRVLSALADKPTYFIDTEFESTRRKTTLSVVQVSAGEDLFLIDALNVARLKELGAILVRPEAEWVIHAGLQDVELLLECFRLPRPPRLFDTQIAWALLGPEANVSLAYLQYQVLGIRTMKSYQADDWMRRPLPEAQLEYAASDIRHLPEIHSHLLEKLSEQSRRDAVSEACHELLWPKPELPGELSLSSFRNAWQLAPANQAALLYLIQWYNELPNWERERAPQPKTMLSIASRLPRAPKDLLRIKGLPPQFNKAQADVMVRGISRAVREARSSDFVQIDPEPYATFEEIQLDAWLATMRAEVASAANVAPELALPPRLMKIWKAAVQQGGRNQVLSLLEGWRKPLLEDALKEFVERTALPAGSTV